MGWAGFVIIVVLLLGLLVGGVYMAVSTMGL